MYRGKVKKVGWERKKFTGLLVHESVSNSEKFFKRSRQLVNGELVNSQTNIVPLCPPQISPPPVALPLPNRCDCLLEQKKSIASLSSFSKNR